MDKEYDYASNKTVEARDTEIPREVSSLAKTVSEIAAHVSEMESGFAAILRPEEENALSTERPEQVVHTKLAASIADIRHSAENVIDRLQSIKKRREI